MKKILVILVILLFFASSVAWVMAHEDSERSNDNGTDARTENASDNTRSEDNHTQDRSADDGSRTSVDDHNTPMNGTEIRSDSPSHSETETDAHPGEGSDIQWEHTNASELEQHIRDKEMEVETELTREGIDDAIKKNQSAYLVGVDAFLFVHELHHTYYDNMTLMENEIWGTLNSSTKAEMQIRSRNTWVRFFMGGDEPAAHELERDIEANEVRIRDLERLIASCNCSESIQNQLRDRILHMDQEQDRLRDLSRQELQDTGIFGWMWR